MSDENKYHFGVEPSKQSRNSNKTHCVLGISIALLSVTVLALVATLIWHYVALADSLGTPTSACKPSDVVERYPGFFRTQQEQKDFQEQYEQLTQKPPTVPLTNCSVTCPRRENIPMRKKREATHAQSRRSDLHALVQAVIVDRKSRQKRQVDTSGSLRYHGCCESQKSWRVPQTGTNLKGETVQIVQTDDNQQYFLQESCSSVSNCDICTCSQPDPYVYDAVVYKNRESDDPDEKYKLEQIQVPGCCKCLNIRKSET